MIVVDFNVTKHYVLSVGLQVIVGSPANCVPSNTVSEVNFIVFYYNVSLNAPIVSSALIVNVLDS